MTIQNEIQKLNPDARITLYELDTTNIGGSTVFRFTHTSDSSGHVTFGGHNYTAIDMVVSGFSWDGQGAFPKPKLQLANVNGLLSSALIELGDLRGANFTRIRTFRQFLDDGSNPNTGEIMPVDYYQVEQKTQHNKRFIEWTLSSILDQTGRKLPGRMVLRDICPFTYRVYDAASDTFKTSRITCPWGTVDLPATTYFDENDNATTKANDQCSKRLSGCKKRYGAHGILPFGGFPGVQRKRSY